MKVKHSSTGLEFDVNEETAETIRATLHLYNVGSAHEIPLALKRDGNMVVWVGWDRAGGPEAFTNGH